MGICAHLTVLITDNDKYWKVVALQGLGAQCLLNLIQAVHVIMIESSYVND